ncbi:DUF6415 family natural product biosynthesis protein [Streptomyces sp. JV185]|uniref:DUF6415 family natural product biosynthesis protein n=1 Tax=Streptomyces sp. JV185 TaxID=858638 RepID=UPI002E787564|nr:hypothetical protein [Streptomyces sp. JV185]MEE1767080.1 DUF6415 family natural product biosynthesis protein [Streptomyces sp. JV185]
MVVDVVAQLRSGRQDLRLADGAVVDVEPLTWRLLLAALLLGLEPSHRGTPLACDQPNLSQARAAAQDRRDYEQIALQLTGHARAIASDVRRRADQLPKDSGPRALADVVLREVEGWLSATLEGTVRCVQSRARLVRALYECLDHLADITSATPL